MPFWQVESNEIIWPLRVVDASHRVSFPVLLYSVYRRCRTWLEHRCVLQGSMTVEAALVLPLFIFFFCNILGFLDMIRLQCVMFAAVRETGTAICEYAYFLDTAEVSVEDVDADNADMPDGISSLILSETYVRSRVMAYLGEDYLRESPIKGDSISFLQSGIMNGDDDVAIVADYLVEPFVPVMAPSSFAMQTRFVGHAWVGYGIEDNNRGGDNEDEEDPLVYITPTGTVYHISSDCTYLKPRIRQTNSSEIADKRSGDGSCYYPCESCRPRKTSGTLYYTTEGNRYHSSPSCSKLKRTIRTVHRSDVENERHVCSKCGG